MDDALAQTGRKGAKFMQETVLILVVMDDALAPVISAKTKKAIMS